MRIRYSVDVVALCRFLLRAKSATFASGARGEAIIEPGGRSFSFEEGLFRYRDVYFGSIFDIGQEVVWHDRVACWGMNYMGGMLPGHEHQADAAFPFLKAALSRAPKELPLRGPAEHREGAWFYMCATEGDLMSFSGREFIQHASRVVYERRFFGGGVVW